MQEIYGGLVSSPVNKMDTYRGSAVTRTLDGNIKESMNIPEEQKPLPHNVIKYTAALKLQEITGFNRGGINTEFFDVSIVSHTFENGIGIIEFDGDLLEIKDGISAQSSKSAFLYCTDLFSIELPNSITKIGRQTFYKCENLNQIKMAGVTDIGNLAFCFCAFDYFCIPNNVVNIGVGIISNCVNLQSVKFNKKITDIPNYMFQECTSLLSLTIPKHITTIGLYCFSGSGITSIKIPANVIDISPYAFNGCNKLKTIIVSKDNPVYDSREKCNALIETSTNKLLKGCVNTTIPNGIQEISSYAFSDVKLKSIIIPEGVSIIGSNAFRSVGLVDYVSIPSTLLSVSLYSFSGTYVLRDNFVNNADISIDGAQLTILDVITQDGIAISLNKVVLFFGSTPDVVLPEGVLEVYGVFSYRNFLNSVIFPSSVTLIDGNCFMLSYNIESVTLYSTTPPVLGLIHYGSLFENIAGLVIYVPAESVDAYKAASGWSTYASKIQAIPEE